VFMVVSTYGFDDVLGNAHTVLDPSRVAAQIVSGIGFIGGGVIFVRRDTLRGLTTAAGVWVTAGVGMACGGDLRLVAIATTVIYMVVAYLFPFLVRMLPRSRFAPSDLRLVYLDAAGSCVRPSRSARNVDSRSPTSRSSTTTTVPTTAIRATSRLTSKSADRGRSPSSPPS
jgi:uncharacterized membrane protein YhiD involved in acid resistance